MSAAGSARRAAVTLVRPAEASSVRRGGGELDPAGQQQARSGGAPARRVRARRIPHRESGKILTRARTLDRLREHATQHGAVRAVWLIENDLAAYRGVIAHFGGMAAARRAAKVTEPNRPRQWSALRVINELRQVHRAGRVRMTTNALKTAGYEPLVAAMRKYIGSIVRARRLARIPEPGTRPTDVFERWDEDRVVGEIRDRHRNGEPLAARKVPAKLYVAARFHCGSWQAALEMAGLDHDQIREKRRPWTRDEVLLFVKRAARKRAQNRNGPTMHALVAPVQLQMLGFFGSLAGALRAADVDPATVMTFLPRERRSKEAMVAELRAAVARQPGVKSKTFFKTRLGADAVARFGSVAAAIDAIGEEHWTARRQLPMLSAAEVIGRLRARHRQGHAMALNATVREDGRLANAAIKRFGTWRRAMEAAGLGALVGFRQPRPRSGSNLGAR